jgi:hypothetical protein
VKKLIPPILFLICLILMGLLRWLWPVRIIFPFPYNLLGIVPILRADAERLTRLRAPTSEEVGQPPGKPFCVPT